MNASQTSIPLETILGRMHAADPIKRPPISRTDKHGTYERLPMSGQEQIDALKARGGMGVRLRLREDLPPKVAKHFSDEIPYRAKCVEYHDRQYNVTAYRHPYDFYPGKELNVPGEHAVYLLMDGTHGQFLETVEESADERSKADSVISTNPLKDMMAEEAKPAPKRKPGRPPKHKE